MLQEYVEVYTRLVRDDFHEEGEVKPLEVSPNIRKAKEKRIQEVDAESRFHRLAIESNISLAEASCKSSGMETPNDQTRVYGEEIVEA